MLGLLTPTDPRWVAAAESNLDGLLSDHAHCEAKAAQSALSLVARYGGTAPELVEPLLALAHEEIDHFAQVETHLKTRGAVMTPPTTDAYVRALRQAAKEDASPHEQDVLLDRLLVCALIEARSCERFKLLSEHLQNPELREFYRNLMTSEARHYRLFAGLAEKRFGEARARARLAILAQREAQLVAQLPLGPTVHG